MRTIENFSATGSPTTPAEDSRSLTALEIARAQGEKSRLARRQTRRSLDPSTPEAGVLPKCYGEANVTDDGRVNTV